MPRDTEPVHLVFGRRLALVAGRRVFDLLFGVTGDGFGRTEALLEATGFGGGASNCATHVREPKTPVSNSATLKRSST